MTDSGFPAFAVFLAVVVLLGAWGSLSAYCGAP